MIESISEPVKGQVVIDGAKIDTLSQEIVSANIISVEVGTTGYCGGDSGHGGRTYVRIKDESSTDMRCRLKGYIKGRGYEDVDCINANTVEIVLGGDCELETFIGVLEFAAQTLRNQIGGGCTMPDKMTYREKKQECFRNYLNDVVQLYAVHGNLNGMSAIRNRYHVTAITKTQFFECGLDEAARANAGIGAILDQDFCNKVYDYVLNRAKGIPAPRYNAG